MSFSGDIGLARIRIVPEIDQAAFRRARQQAQAAVGGGALSAGAGGAAGARAATAAAVGGAAGGGGAAAAAGAGALSARLAGTRREVVDLNASAKELRQSLRGVGSEAGAMRRGLTAASSGMGALAARVAPLVGVAGLALVANRLRAVSDEAFETGDALAKTSNRVGIAAESYQRLSFAAELSGVSQGQLDAGIAGLAKRVGEARLGTGELILKLEEMNPALLENLTSARSVEEQVLLVADAMGEMKDSTDKVTLSASLFGRGAGTAMITLLQNGRAPIKESGDLLARMGAIIEQDVLKNVERVNDAFATLARVQDQNLKRATLGTAEELERLARLVEDPATIAAYARLGEAQGELANKMKALEVQLAVDSAAFITWGDKVDRAIGKVVQGIIDFTGLNFTLPGGLQVGGLTTEQLAIEERRRASGSVLDTFGSLRRGGLFPEVEETTTEPPPTPTVPTRDFAAEVLAATELRAQAERELTMVGLSEADKRRAGLEAEMDAALRAVEGNAEARKIVLEAFHERALALEADLSLSRQQAGARLGDQIRDQAAQLELLQMPPGAARDAAQASMDFERSIRNVREQADALRREGLIDEETIRAWEDGAQRLEAARLAERLAEPIRKLRREVVGGFLGDMREAVREGEDLWQAFGDAVTRQVDRLADLAFERFLDETLLGPGTGSPLDGLLGAVLGVPASGGPQGGTPPITPQQRPRGPLGGLLDAVGLGGTPGASGPAGGSQGSQGAAPVVDVAGVEAAQAVELAVLGDNVPAIQRVEDAVRAVEVAVRELGDVIPSGNAAGVGGSVDRVRTTNEGGFSEVSGAVLSAGNAVQGAVLASGNTQAQLLGSAIGAQNEGNIIAAVVGFATGLQNRAPAPGNDRPPPLMPAWVPESGEMVAIPDFPPEFAGFSQQGSSQSFQRATFGQLVLQTPDSDSFLQDDMAALRATIRQLEGIQARG